MWVREQFESKREGQSTGISKISRLSSDVESKITVCLWHTIHVFEKKIQYDYVVLSKVPDRSFESEIFLSKQVPMHKL